MVPAYPSVSSRITGRSQGHQPTWQYDPAQYLIPVSIFDSVNRNIPMAMGILPMVVILREQLAEEAATLYDSF